jgi:UDP-N-acetylglucosamine 2-epimerase
MPNADTGGRIINRMIEDFVERHSRCWLIGNLGTRYYFSLMAQAAAMVGNSSSGMVEAAPLGLPVVNIGSRQKGRIRTANIIDVDYPRDEILKGIRKAASSEFQKSVEGMASPFGDGHAAERIVSVLKDVKMDDRLTTKRFADLPAFQECVSR